MNHATRFTNVCARQITGICAIIYRPKKHVLNYFVLEMAAVIVARGGTTENRERVVEGKGFFHTY